MDQVPVVFIQLSIAGKPQGHVAVAVAQARVYNDLVVLLGDSGNAGLDVEHKYLDDYVEGREFAQHYRHMSTNPEEFELVCFQRWFALREFMQRHGYSKIFTCDTDVLLYSDVAEADRFGEYLVCYSVPTDQPEYRWSASAHVSYWTLEGIDEVCEFIWGTYTTDMIQVLEEKWAYHQETGKPGGICDMTLLYKFSQLYDVASITQVVDGTTFDHRIGGAENLLPEEYRMENDIKQITWRDNQPYGYNIVLDAYVRFSALHFQGGSKKLMREYMK